MHHIYWIWGNTLFNPIHTPNSSHAITIKLDDATLGSWLTFLCPLVSINLVKMVARIPNGTMRQVRNHALTSAGAPQWCSQEVGGDAVEAPLFPVQAAPGTHPELPERCRHFPNCFAPRLYSQEFCFPGFCLGSDLLIFPYELVRASSRER